MLLRRLFSLLLVSLGLCQVHGALTEGPSTTIALPGQDVEFLCNTTEVPLWRVDGDTYSLNQLFMGALAGHNSSGTNIVVTNIVLGDSRNGSEYRCVIQQLPPTPDIISDPAFLYVAGPPDMPVVTLDLGSVNVMTDGIDFTFTFTLNWDTPSDNLDPIQNYTITIGCTGSGCPLMLTADSSATSFDVSYTTSITNVTIMVTANNNVGASDPDVLDVTTPGSVQNIVVSCEPVELLNQCTVEWDLLAYGNSSVQPTIRYNTRISGSSINTTMMDTPSFTVTFDLPPVDSNIFVTVEATNVFGSGGTATPVENEIMSPSVEDTESIFLDDTNPAQTYDLEVVCDIMPNRTAEYCEVFARGGVDVVTAVTSIMNDMATVTVSSLMCEGTYAITAGGITATDGMMDQTLDGPRFHTETVTASACLLPMPTITSAEIMPTATMPGTPTRTAGGTGGNGDSNIGAIVGGVVGGIVAVLLIIVIVVVIIYCCCINRDSGSRSMSPSGDKLPVTGAGAGAGRPTSVRVQTLDRYGKPMTDESDGGNVELTDYKPVTSPEFTVNQVPSGNNQLTTKEESRTPSSYMPEGSYDTLAPADEPQGQSVPPTQNGQDQPQKGKLNYAELEQFSRKPASVKKPETQPPSQYAVIDPKSLQGTYT